MIKQRKKAKEKKTDRQKVKWREIFQAKRAEDFATKMIEPIN